MHHKAQKVPQIVWIQVHFIPESLPLATQPVRLIFERLTYLLVVQPITLNALVSTGTYKEIQHTRQS